MRNMSFQLTVRQFRARTKTVTRRFGWWGLQPGDVVMGCEKCQGIKKGEQIKKLGPIRIVNTRVELLQEITPQDVILEGFPGMTPAQFVEMFCRHMDHEPGRVVNRIEFAHLCLECDGAALPGGGYYCAACLDAAIE